MQPTYSTEVSLFFKLIPTHICAFIQYWHKFTSSMAVEIWFLHPQPFIESVVYSSGGQLHCIISSLCCIHICPWSTGPCGVIVILDASLTIFELCTIVLTCCTLYFATVRLCQLVGNFRGWTYSARNNCMALHLDARQRGVVNFVP